LRRWLTTATRLRRFNLAMAGLLVLSLWPVLQALIGSHTVSIRYPYAFHTPESAPLPRLRVGL
jgi:hypothetical protein